jgi:hypothetical protein
MMKLSFPDRCLLLLIALFLGVIAARPLFQPKAVSAQTQNSHIYFEPGTHLILTPDKSRQVLGKVAVDLNSGNVWGFPTLADVPYPVPEDPGKNTPPVSTPIYLGRFDLSRLSK